MKAGSDADYVVRVLERGWFEPEEQESLYEGMYTFDLNQVVAVAFVPRVTPEGPSWLTAGFPGNRAHFTIPEQVRILEVLTTPYSVTPDDERAGTVQQLDWPFEWPPENGLFTPPDEPPPTRTVFFITTDEFDRLSTDLAALFDIAGDVQSMVRHSEVADHEAVRFVDQRILDSPWLQPEHAASVGRTG
jgi:hypothetical protein